MISAGEANIVVNALDDAREQAASLAKPYLSGGLTVTESILSETRLIACLRTAADSFGLELVPKCYHEQKENASARFTAEWTPNGMRSLNDAYAAAPPKSMKQQMLDALSRKGVNPKDAIGAQKVPMGYFPPAALLYATLGLWNGDVKYDKYNWREGGKVLASIYIDAVERHLGLWKSGEEIDPKSGVPHLGHALAGLAILVDALEGGYLVDDRPKNQYDFGALLDKWNAQGPSLVKGWKKERADREAKATT